MKVAGRLLVHFMFNHCNYNIIGFTSDGEWNSLRTKGNTRPLSVFQILSNARRKYAQKKQHTMIEMLTPLCKYACLYKGLCYFGKLPGNANGIFSTRVPNNAVSQELLAQIHGWITAGATMDDVIERLRLRTVPTGYAIHNWTNGIVITHVLCKMSHHFLLGKDESLLDKLRSILAQLEYKHQIDHWHSKGVPFKDHLYVPEVHPFTRLGFCEREDEAHVLKVQADFLCNKACAFNSYPLLILPHNCTFMCMHIFYKAFFMYSTLDKALDLEDMPIFSWRDLWKPSMIRLLV